jgi:hypothetical protein
VKPERNSSILHNANWNSILEFLSGLRPHSVYSLAFIVNTLKDYGLSVNISGNSDGINIGGRFLAISQPDQGSAGIWSLELVNELYNLVIGDEFYSAFIGIGFQYRDILDRLREFLLLWGLLEPVMHFFCSLRSLKAHATQPLFEC